MHRGATSARSSDRRSRWRDLLPWCLAPLGACALTAPPAASVLAAPAAGADAQQAELDAAANAALRRSLAAPGDAGAGLAAAELLFQAADLRLQRATLARLDAMPAADLAAVVAADDGIGDPARTEILALCTDGLAAADHAVAAGGAAPIATALQRGLHLSLVAWANGPARSLFAGYGPKLTAAIDAAVAADPDYDHAAPLRLAGRFRSSAPWPLGDLPAACAALQRAVATAPIVVNLLFYGDALFRSGDRAAAAGQWRAAVDAPADDATRWSADLLRELARRRLQALARADGG